MKMRSFGEPQILAIFRHASGGTSAPELYREYEMRTGGAQHPFTNGDPVPSHGHVDVRPDEHAQRSGL